MEDTIQGWIARDTNDALWLYREGKPIKHSHGFWSANASADFYQLQDSDFPSVKSEDEEPTEIEIKIKR